MAQLISNDRMEPKKLRIQFKRRVDSSWSWVVCLAAFIVQFFVVGTINSFGSFFVAFLQEFQGSEGATAWIGSLVVGLTFISGPIVTSFCDRWGCRVVMCIGSVAFMAGMLLSSLVSNLSLMYVTYSLIIGFAGGCSYYSSFYAVVLHFNKHLAVATGITLSGSGAGTIAISFGIDKSISQYGLRMTFQGMAAASVILILAALTFVPVDLVEGDEKLWMQKAAAETKKGMTARERIYCALRSLLCPAPVWKNKAFVVWTITLALTLIAYYIPYVFLIRLAEDIGIPTAEGALLVGYCALAQVLGKIVFGKLAESNRISRLTIIQTALLVMAVASCLCPLARSHTALLTYAVVLGFFDGCVVVLIGLVTQDIVGREMITKAVGVLFATVAIPMTVGPPMAGLLHDKTGNYNIVFFVASGLVTSGVCLMFLIPVLLPPKKDPRKVILPGYTKTSDSISIELHEAGGIADDSFIGYEELDRLSHTSNEDRNRLLLERPNFESRPSSFILFSIVTADSFRDLSSPNDRYSNSRATSRTSLARVCELKVESRSNSCARLEPRLEPLRENEATHAFDTCTSRDRLHVIVEPPTEITRSHSLDNFKDNELNIKVPEIQADFLDKDGVSKMISESTESGFVSEDSTIEISAASKVDEKRLSGYSWNSTTSDLSWKFHSEGETDDSGFGEAATPYSTGTRNGDLQGTVEKEETGANGNPELLESNIYESSESCACSLIVNPNELMPGNTNAKEIKEGSVTLDCYSQPFESQQQDVPDCACAKPEESQPFDGSKSNNEINETFVDELPQPPDIFSQMFEGILEEVNEYVQIFSELPIYENSPKIWPGEIAADLRVQGRETEV